MLSAKVQAKKCPSCLCFRSKMAWWQLLPWYHSEEHLVALFWVDEGETRSSKCHQLCWQGCEEGLLPSANAFDRQLHMLCTNGIGVKCKQAEVTTQDMESQLQAVGVLCVHLPQSLLTLSSCITGKVSAWGVYMSITLCVSVSSNTLAILINIFTESLAQKNHSGGVNDAPEGKVV